MPEYTMEAVAEAICDTSGCTFGGGIGQGACKETYLATEVASGTKLAVKILRPGCSSERNQREVDAMMRCAHPNIVALLRIAQFEYAGTEYTYLVEAFMDGGTLEDRLKGGLLSRVEVLALGDQLIAAASHIAGKNLVHRDFKPANIMYLATGAEALVGDFGIVRDLRKTSLTQSYFQLGPGTPFFASPEQLNNEKAMIDWRTDQFAIGVTLAIAHFGFHPYHEGDEGVGEVIGRVAGRCGPSARLARTAEEDRLPVLTKMVAPWSAGRIRTPDALKDAWGRQKEL